MRNAQEELIEEGFSEDDVEFGIESALNTLDEGYYDSAVAASKAASKTSLKDRVKSAAKKAIMGTARAAGKVMKAKATAQAAPAKAKAKAGSIVDRLKRVAKKGYESGRGPVEKTTTYRGSGVGRKEKIGEEASMSTQEIALQKRKANIDAMIARKRKQELSKKSEAPTKAMGEATEDSLRDRRMERGGVGGNQRYDRAPKAPNTKKFGTGKTMAQKEMEKKYGKGKSAMDIVRADITAKYGKGAIMDKK